MKTARRIPLLKKMLAQLGIEEERVGLEWVSASEGDRFARVVNEMTEKIRLLGPLNPNGGVPQSFEAMTELAPDLQEASTSH